MDVRWDKLQPRQATLERDMSGKQLQWPLQPQTIDRNRSGNQTNLQWPRACFSRFPRPLEACPRGQQVVQPKESSKPQPGQQLLQPLTQSRQQSGCSGRNTPTPTPTPTPIATPPLTPTAPGQDYPFRYDDGLSARLGVKRIPLIMRQRCRDGEFIFKNPPYPIDKPLRTQRKQQQPWWKPVECPVMQEKPIHSRRHIGVFCDPSRCAPNETILRNF